MELICARTQWKDRMDCGGQALPPTDLSEAWALHQVVFQCRVDMALAQQSCILGYPKPAFYTR